MTAVLERDPGVLALTSGAEIERALRAATWLGRPHVSTVVLDPSLPDDGGAAAAEADQIKRAFNDCGCAWGEMALLATVLALVGTHVSTGDPGWVEAVGLAITAAVVGKAAGLARSRRQLHHVLRRLAASYPTDEEGGGHHGRTRLP